MSSARWDRLASIMRDIDEMSAIGRQFDEELCLNRRDLISRIERRTRERGTPLAGKILRARRERRARDREHSRKGVLKAPSKHLSTWLRVR